jgi:small subunit ribosomal protein S8
MNTDPIADLLTRIRNAQNAHQASVNLPHSKIKEGILDIMKKWKFIEDYKVENEGINKSLNVTLREDREKLTLKRVSKCGQRIYVKKEDLKIIKSGLGISILSTSQGLMTNLDAKKHNIGGELICEIY